MIKPTMSHALDKNHLNELLISYYEELVIKHGNELKTIMLMLEKGFPDRAKSECKNFINQLED